jgi:protein gp37
MSDFFHTDADQWRDEAWAVIRACPWLDWLILTKRIEGAAERLPDDWGDGYSNVWLGVTAGVPASLPRLDSLLQIPAAVRFLSAEPLLERLDLTPWLHGLNWVIAGGESGGKRRPSDVEWYQSLHDQCQSHGVRFYMKQDTAFRDGQQGRIGNDLWNVKQYPKLELEKGNGQTYEGYRTFTQNTQNGTQNSVLGGVTSTHPVQGP